MFFSNDTGAFGGFSGQHGAFIVLPPPAAIGLAPLGSLGSLGQVVGESAFAGE